MASYAQRLHRRLNELVELQDKLLEASAIKYDPDRVARMSRRAGVAIMTFSPDSFWQPLDDRGHRIQRDVLGRWKACLEQIRLLFADDAVKSRKELEKAAEKIIRWLEQSGRDFSVPKTIDGAGAVFRGHAEPLFKLLAPFQSEGGGLVVVPDTNVLLRSLDLHTWGDTLGTDEFTALLVPGVLAEMDAHKVNHKNPDVREKARKFSNRVKGWRNQGRLSDGIRVQGNVYVKVAAREPDFGKTLSWLDSDVVDDRILASLLAYQWANPSDDVRLLTGDTNMLTKADEAMIPTDDVPNPF